jgi:hypothetical protein
MIKVESKCTFIDVEVENEELLLEENTIYATGDFKAFLDRNVHNQRYDGLNMG